MTSMRWKRLRLVLGGTAFAVACLAGQALAVVQPESTFDMPRDASVYGKLIDDFIWEGIYVDLPLFIGVCVWLVWVALAYRDKQHKAVYDHGSFKHPVAMGVCVVAVAVLVLDDAYSWFESNHLVSEYFWNFKDAEAKANAVRIEVNGHQWAWNARYAGPDGKFNTSDDIVTLNDVRVPNDAPVIIELTSVDVIHDLWFPNMRVKQDAVPGMVNRMMFYPKEIGEYDIGCAQHCGVNHYKMKGLLTVLSRKDYEMWTNEASQNSARLWDPDDSIAHWGWDWTWKKD
jgi:cytochrome c oxidase subunit II